MVALKPGAARRSSYIRCLPQPPDQHKGSGVWDSEPDDQHRDAPTRGPRRGATRLYWTTKQDNTTARALYDKVAAFNGFIRYDLAL
jgi:hypothetical protein